MPRCPPTCAPSSASPTRWCASQSASRTPTISSPTSQRRWGKGYFTFCYPAVLLLKFHATYGQKLPTAAGRGCGGAHRAWHGHSRRAHPAQAFASRLAVTLPTLRKLERGDPGVALATFVTALWLIGLLDRLRDLAKPENDVVGNILETARLPQRVRKSRHDDFT